MVLNVALLFLPIWCVSIITVIRIDRDKRRREREFLLTREQERRSYLQKILETQENERRRIAQDLHDEVIQTLLFVAHSAENLTLSLESDEQATRQIAIVIKDLAIQTVDDLRAVCTDLRSHILDDLGLVPALRWLANGIDPDHGVQAQVTVRGLDRRLASFAEIAVFRIVQEALNNIKRHSKAKNASIDIEFADAIVRIAIWDDGIGFEPVKILQLASEGKFGLFGMAERIKLLDGKFEIVSQRGEGTRLVIEVKA